MAGVDEAGRGPLAGPVVVAAVVLPEGWDSAGIDDSKSLSRSQREEAFARITDEAAYWIETVSVEEIDRLNILHATLAGMTRCLNNLRQRPQEARVDGNTLPLGVCCRCEAWVKGDSRDAAIAAASILAKVTRDRWMAAAADDHPGYGFESHFGYAAPSHLEAIARLGPCPIHRRSFEPVKSMLNQPCLMLDI